MDFEVYFSLGSTNPRKSAILARVHGLVALGLGVIAIIVGLKAVAVSLLQPPFIGSDLLGLVFVVGGLLFASVGYWLCTRLPYRPDLGDIHPLAGKAGGYNSVYVAERRKARRKWWTGDER